MGTIGIVVNPYSGKDVRRIVTYATAFDNQEKISIIRRILSGICELGNHRIYIMPDDNHLSDDAVDGMNNPDVKKSVTIPDSYVSGEAKDTSNFVKYVTETEHADVVIVLGGDGTSRVAAKTIGDVPIIPVSTGTNNVYPVFIEGTAVAMAASAVAENVLRREEFPHGKLIEVSITNGQRDIALVDAVLSKKSYIGARAITKEEDIDAIFVTQAHPANIGFSGLVGSIHSVSPDDDIGIYAKLNWQDNTYIAAIATGMLTRFGADDVRSVGIGDKLVLQPRYSGTVALDGEREMTFGPEDTVTMKITRNGPRKVDVKDAVKRAAELGYLRSPL